MYLLISFLNIHRRYTSVHLNKGTGFQFQYKIRRCVMIAMIANETTIQQTQHDVDINNDNHYTAFNNEDNNTAYKSYKIP